MAPVRLGVARGATRAYLLAWLGLVAGLAPAPAQARDDLGFAGSGAAEKKTPYLAPDGSFAAQVPSFWQARDFQSAHVVEFRLPGAGEAWLQVRRTDIQPGVSPRQLLLRAREDRLAKLPHFQEGGRRDVVLNGHPAAILVGSFWYQGNAEYPRAVEELYMVVGQEAFETHFECFAPTVADMRSDLLLFYQSFVPHPVAAPPPLKTPTAPDSDAFFDRLPF